VAIVKVSYTKSRKKIKASVRYIQHRPGKEGERLSRPLFGVDGPLSRDEAYNLIDQAAKGTTFFRVVISPDPRREDTDRDLNLREITEQTIVALSERLGQSIQYVGAIHDDHAPHRHVHVVVMIQGKLDRQDFRALRQAATGSALFQRQERDLARGIVRKSPERPLAKGSPPPSGGVPDKKLKRCAICGTQNCMLHDNEAQLKEGL